MSFSVEGFIKLLCEDKARALRLTQQFTTDIKFLSSLSANWNIYDADKSWKRVLRAGYIDSMDRLCKIDRFKELIGEAFNDVKSNKCLHNLLNAHLRMKIRKFMLRGRGALNA